jgi:hypothetical protein
VIAVASVFWAWPMLRAMVVDWRAATELAGAS